jgi:hypothetical protein
VSREETDAHAEVLHVAAHHQERPAERSLVSARPPAQDDLLELGDTPVGDWIVTHVSGRLTLCHTLKRHAAVRNSRLVGLGVCGSLSVVTTAIAIFSLTMGDRGATIVSIVLAPLFLLFTGGTIWEWMRDERQPLTFNLDREHDTEATRARVTACPPE